MATGVAIQDPSGAPIVAFAMAKRGAIPRDQNPNAAPRGDVERVRKRIEALGIEFQDAVQRAGFSRITYFRLKNGQASVATLRKLDEWTVAEERKLDRPTAGTIDEQAAALEEWQKLGEELLGLSPSRFRTTIDGLRDVVDSERLAQRAARKIYR